jgi:hypothetical protein
MRLKKQILLLGAGIVLLGANSCATLQQAAGTVLSQTGGEGGLTSSEIASGLKEALSVGATNSGSKASALDGFFKNEAIKLLFPPEAQKVESKLRQIGLGPQCDQFILSLNRGAEEAAKDAAPIFINAIKQMTIADALGILRGEKDAATQYLKRTSQQALIQSFKPVIERSLDKVNATKNYEAIANTYNKIPFVQKVNADLPGYATDKTIDGIFMLVADEEAQIRENPLARTSELLKRVFGSNK